jgi:hypothetical protein
LAGGALALTAARAHAQDGAALPTTGGRVTVAGCLQRGGKHNKLVLARPAGEAVTSVTEPTCALAGNEVLIELKDTHAHHLDDSMIGRWIEISGRLEKIEKHDDADDLRELHVRAFREVPVAARVAEAPPTPAPPTIPEAPLTPTPSDDKPVATSGVATDVVSAAPVLPGTASALPLIALMSGLSMAAAFGVRRVRLIRGKRA